MTGTIAVIMIFSIPLLGIITDHFQKQSKMKQKMIEDQLELERLKHDNFVIETQKLRLELEQMNVKDSKEKSKIL
ncbi:hypothetical protein LS684_21540 (plasmid) [Cytobacillus spongiae]|uniref:hypothetical protein n=1 Tax=Cytobacillus spongiae TaxID=2901381 RepID=UPI001F391F1F|nr:hypothetical protein [Cytobacillus spongiae]UII58203.1 hypothetical protein LS684_21540 [Cytobacillus spongiae]